MDLQEIAKRIDYSRPYSKSVILTLTGNSGTATGTIRMSDVDLYIDNVSIVVKDNTGKILDPSNTNVFDATAVQIENNGKKWHDGEDSDQLPSLEALKQRFMSRLFRGITLKKNTTYKFTLDGVAYPSASVGTYPYRIEFLFSGYILND